MTPRRAELALYAAERRTAAASTVDPFQVVDLTTGEGYLVTLPTLWDELDS